MSWTNLPATGATDWSHVDFLNQFVHAIRERRASLNQSALPALIAEVDDVQTYTLLRGFQNLVQGLTGSFVNHIAYPDGYAGLTGLSNINWNTITWRTSAGIPADGFTRKYPREISSPSDPGEAGQRAWLPGEPPDEFLGTPGIPTRVYEHDGTGWLLATDQLTGPDTLIAYGLMQPEDYIGPWIFNELKAGLNLLRWTGKEIVPGNAEDAKNRHGGLGHATYADAQAATLAADPTSFSFFYGCWTVASFDTVDSTYSASIQAAALTLVASIPGAGGMVCDVNWYGLTGEPGSGDPTFDPLDQTWFDVPDKGLYVLHSSDAAVAIASGANTVIGNRDWLPPPWADEPAGLTTKGRGYRIVRASYVLKWDVPGGFEYL